MTSEFDLIAKYFTRPTPRTLLGVGDDAALLTLGSNMELAISTDTLVEGTHFFPDANPRQLGWKALAVNVSDMAAMAANPHWATMALTLPAIDDAWLKAFSEGFFDCAQRFGVDLMGGDTTRGPLSISITVMGDIPIGGALRRDAAKYNDDIWVSGQLGNAALGLAALQGRVPREELESCIAALHSPQPQAELGLALRGRANAAIDISDGLLADLGHIVERSKLGADIKFDAIPRSPILSRFMHDPIGQECLLTGGEDYELCFTAPARRDDEIRLIGEKLKIRLTRIGKITSGKGVRLLDVYNKPIPYDHKGYDHFSLPPLEPVAEPGNDIAQAAEDVQTVSPPDAA